MFIHLKSGFNTDMGPAWISPVRFSKTWKTAYWQGRRLRRWQGVSGNFIDLTSGEEFWLSGPQRDQGDTRDSNVRPEISEDVRELYEAFLNGARLPGRENG